MRRLTRLIGSGLLTGLLVGLGYALTVGAQPTPTTNRVSLWNGTITNTLRNLAGAKPIDVSIVDAAGNQIVAFGGAGGTAQADDNPLALITPIGALYDTTPPAVADGNVGIPRMDASRYLLMDCVVGCGGSTFADATAFTFGATVVSPFAGVVDDVATNTVAENSAGTPRMSTDRILYANPRTVAGVEIPFPTALAAGGGFKIEGVAGGVAIPVSGTFWQATQPVSGTFWPATQPVSGTVTADAGTNLNTSLLALEAGGNLALIKAKTDNLDVLLSTRLKAADTLAAVTTVGTITNPVAVTGTFWQATQPVSGTVTANTNPGTYANGSGTAILDGTVAVTDAAQALGAGAIVQVLIQSIPTNVEYVYVGNNASQNTLILPGQAVTVNVTNLNIPYVKCAAGKTATVAYLAR